jgi:hypothetical protein
MQAGVRLILTPTGYWFTGAPVKDGVASDKRGYQPPTGFRQPVLPAF